jgi:outer membrane lipoprotein-sorting protein
MSEGSESFIMIDGRRLGAAGLMTAICFLALLGIHAVQAQQPGDPTVIRGVDAAVKARSEGIKGYTATEHYAVYRNNDETHPVAEMTVKTEYREDMGKSYTILSQSGSELVQKFVLGSILSEEKRLSQPGNREGAWLTSANYEMKLKPGGPERLDGRDCLVLAITPRRKAPNLLAGTLWVDARDDSIVQVQGIASKSPSIFTGPTQMMRQYASVSGFAMATHARAVSNSNLLGRTVVTIDYREYKIQLRPAR